MVKKRRRRYLIASSLQVGVTPEELSAAYPRLYHMAAAGSWPSIRRYGLLSTSALLSLFEKEGEERAQMESAHRPESVTLRHPRHGTAVVRDQIPMSDAGLRRSLRDGMTPREWYELLNSKVFFWLTEERLGTLLGARAYRDKVHTVLVLDTGRLVTEYEDRILLSPMNSGATKPMAHPRGRETFLPLSRYPYATRRKSRRVNAVVELAVEKGVDDIERYMVSVLEKRAGERGRVIWTRNM